MNVDRIGGRIPLKSDRHRFLARQYGFIGGTKLGSDLESPMKYERFEDLPVWQAASSLAVRVFAVGEKAPLRRHRSLHDQIERAALSVSNNIAEGFERGTTNELLAFLYIARGSAGEVRSMLCVMERMAAFSDLKSEISDLKSIAESISANCAVGRSICRTPPSAASAT
jgi:four helix bundle protein